MASPTILSKEFTEYYDSDLDSLYLDLKVNGKWISSGVWKDIGYVGHCCQEGGMYAISHHYQEKIEEARVRIYPGSDGWGDTTKKPLFDIYLSPRDLRYLAREHKQGVKYRQSERREKQSDEPVYGTFNLNIRI